jgi:hypothetical protein
MTAVLLVVHHGGDRVYVRGADAAGAGAHAKIALPACGDCLDECCGCPPTKLTLLILSIG